MTRNELIAALGKDLLSLPQNRPLRVAVDGIDAAGKTTLADELAEWLIAAGRPVLRSSIDRFHNPREIRYQRGPNSPQGYYLDSFDLDSLIHLLLEPLGPNGSQAVVTGLFDFHTDTAQLEATHKVPEHTILLFDGVFLQRPELVPYWDRTLFLDIRFETSLARALQRDVELFGSPEITRQRYEQRYIPGQQLYLETCRPAQTADIWIDHNNPAEPCVLRAPWLASS